MSLASTPAPKSSEAGLPFPAIWRAVGRQLGQMLNQERVLGYFFVLPAVGLLVGLVAYPFVIALWLSLTDAYVGRGGSFVGLGNFVTLFMEDEIFRQTLRNSIVEGTVQVRDDVGAQPSESEEVVSTALGGDWEFRGIRSPRRE